MEDGVNGSSVSPPGSKVIHKSGWLKKTSGLLGLWKDRYIQILHTQLQVFDSEDGQRCLETLELANYERCQDQKAFLKRKKHFNLIPSPGTKVPDVKFQARNAEERDVWIQALNDGINRGKNKVFDEVTVDPKCSLEHVTRDRAKTGAAKRRPPTRIHLKEVADAAADDSLRLGLEALDTGILTVVPPTPKEKDEEPKPQKESVQIPMPPTKQNNLPTSESSIHPAEPKLQKEPVKIPMPPTKQNNLLTSESSIHPEEPKLQKEPVKIPMPPTKQNNLLTSESSIHPEEPKLQKEPVKIPMPPTKQNNLPTSESSIHPEEPKLKKEPVKIPMPLTKQNNLPSMESSNSETDSDAQVSHVPPPPSKSLKENIYAREKLLSENSETDVENKSEPEVFNSPSEQNIRNVVSSPPKPPPKILSDKMKIKWVRPSSELMEKEDISVERGSKENLVEIQKTSPCQTMICDNIEIEEKKGSTKSLPDGNEVESNDVDDDQSDTEETRNDKSIERTTEEKHIFGENDITTDDSQTSSTEQPVIFLDDTNISPRFLNKRQNKPVPAERHLIDSKPKASSMGDLLSERNVDFGSKKDGSMVNLTKDRLNIVEMKLACGRQRTETLLNKVLNGQHEKAEEGSGLDVNSATLLNKVMRDLQEASEALKEIKGPNNATPEGGTDGQKEKQKELLALQRRTVHF
ncbi:pleckstrin homology domain-containing family O member 2 isoform 2-T2 [Anomaloglossus baeobatrachus]|uniref:pleckstrin homology domain-containing family O member 2 isoform X2 n=1 Tax=Anomaloglossus baeobatrachus TaxID=238106 RepID=UPI003F5095C3